MADRDARMTLPGPPQIEVHVRRHGRARRMSLRVSRLDGRVTLTLPPGASTRAAREFLQRQDGWVRRHVDTQPEPVLAEPGAVLPVLGSPCTVEAAPGARPGLAAGVVRIDGSKPASPQVAALLKTIAREELAAACAGYGRILGRQPTALVLRDPRSRWGSCSSAGRLMFSWRLAMAPRAVLAYVAAHEMAHLREMNHSAAFWRLVAALEPDHKPAKDWLRRHGAALHSVRFAP